MKVKLGNVATDFAIKGNTTGVFIDNKKNEDELEKANKK